MSTNTSKLFAGFVLLTTAAFSQSTTGAITGQITDPDGGVFPVAFIQLKNSQTAAVSNSVGAGGKYSLAEIAPGTYDLSVTVPGMKSFEKTGIAIQPGQTLTIDVRLEDSPSLRTLGEDPAGIAAAFINKPPPPEGPAPHTTGGHPDFSGVWLGGPGTLPLDMFPWAEALAKERTANNSKDYPPTHCLPAGPVPLLSAGFFELVQAPRALIMILEGDTPGYREIFLDGRAHPKDFGPTWLGHSTGTWDGDVLVIDTVGFRDKGWMGFEGPPHTEGLHVVQRVRRPDLGHLEIQVTVEDAGAFRKPASTVKTATLDSAELQEFICNENNLDAQHLVGK